MNEIRRQNLGVCHQYDSLMPKLTVYEHLKFVCDCKGVESHSREKQIDEVLTSLMISTVFDKRVDQLTAQ
jgi:ABC-type multidrug transport system ATPase subunit